MTQLHLETMFGNNWKEFRDVLRRTAPQIVETFRGTDLEDNFSQWYNLSVPQNGESPINFLLRNQRLSYATTSLHQGAELAANNILARMGWYFGKVPLLRRIIRLNECSTELYLGQETRGYVSDRQEIKENGFGNDTLRFVSSNFARSMDLDIDVGFTNPYSQKNGRDCFYQINVYDESLVHSAEQAYEVIQEAKLNGARR